MNQVHAGFTTSANDFLVDKTKLYYGARDTTECDRSAPSTPRRLFER
jgi:hypothetical protein